jgi:signal peptidase II
LRLKKYFLFALVIILVDQAIKLAVHYNMEMGPGGEVVVFGDWFKLQYILNPGMAFGISFDSIYGKLGLTLFRLSACIFILYTINRLSKSAYSDVLLWGLAAILAGAFGNVIDSVFYGVLLENAPLTAVTPWFHGQVIDMFYFDLWEGYLPHWVPIWGGAHVSLWPIFNLADVSIFFGCCIAGAIPETIASCV